MCCVMQVFAQLFGKALQAQTRIAVVNTLLTFAGMWALGIPGLLLLSLFVFMCRCDPFVHVHQFLFYWVSSSQ